MSAAERMRRLRARRKKAGLKSVTRWLPSMGDPPPVYSVHRLFEARSLAMHALIAEKITRDRHLLEIPQRNLERWSRRFDQARPRWLEEWSRVLRRPWHEIAGLIAEPSERAARLRQSSPFAGVLTPEERQRVYEAFRP